MGFCFMADWQITATTIYCSDIDDEVTLMLHGDRTVKCSHMPRYANPDKDTARILKQKSRQAGKPLRCLADNCPRLLEYRTKWMGG